MEAYIQALSEVDRKEVKRQESDRKQRFKFRGD